MIKELITKVTANNRTFYILKDENGYWGIEDKYFKNGVLTKTINGLSGHLTSTSTHTINLVLQEIEADRLIDEGMDVDKAITQAYKTIYNLN